MCENTTKRQLQFSCPVSVETSHRSAAWDVVVLGCGASRPLNQKEHQKVGIETDDAYAYQDRTRLTYREH